jgi:hypothetical protein
MKSAVSLAERLVAAAATLAIPLALRVLPLPRVLAVCDAWPRVSVRAARPPALAHRVRRWLAHGRGPWKSTCLTRSVVLYAMLRQHGHRPELRVGVAGPARAFDAHAWVIVDGQAVDQPAGVVESYRELRMHHA